MSTWGQKRRQWQGSQQESAGANSLWQSAFHQVLKTVQNPGVRWRLGHDLHSAKPQRCGHQLNWVPCTDLQSQRTGLPNKQDASAELEQYLSTPSTPILARPGHCCSVLGKVAVHIRRHQMKIVCCWEPPKHPLETETKNLHQAVCGPCCNPGTSDRRRSRAQQKTPPPGRMASNVWYLTSTSSTRSLSPYAWTMTTESGSGWATLSFRGGTILRLRMTSIRKTSKRLSRLPWLGNISSIEVSWRTLYCWCPKPSWNHWTGVAHKQILSPALALPFVIASWNRCSINSRPWRGMHFMATLNDIEWEGRKLRTVQTNSWVVSQVHHTRFANWSPTTRWNSNVVEVPDHSKLCQSYMAGTEWWLPGGSKRKICCFLVFCNGCDVLLR